MKIDRLLGITIYLLNHKKASSQVLAEQFEVSVRTILRDIDTLCMAGIPVISTYGADGGYEILDTFQMERQIAGNMDYTYIITALQGFASAYPNKELDSTLEKLQAVSAKSSPAVVLDFGILREKENINHKLSLLEQAIRGKCTVTFSYTNSDNVKKDYEVEPVASMYQWYSWYLLCYYPKYKDYRTFKLNRMEQISVTGQKNSREHNTAEARALWEKQADNRRYLHIRLLCSGEIRIKCQEYLNGRIEREFENGDFLFSFSIPEKEQFWFGTLLSFGNKARVLEPEELKHRILSTCQDIFDQYKNV